MNQLLLDECMLMILISSLRLATKKSNSVIAAVVSDFLCPLQGRMVEIYGREASGKTTLALHIIKEAQKLGGDTNFVLLYFVIGVLVMT